ncbi:hypothetical protein UA08_00750 [Talaromyces atroroseus]|uniref:Cyclase n=1 Tax=Talaromyces atroroseus TaxID=1441469 RepID=A0A225BCM4_TALAT|nr:hypothetical protein UA08_00750 [Talaromyces atroroseus]OKL63797.1 hypothetical protein UA08_00750 [Talaromyces atroroseus]
MAHKPQQVAALIEQTPNPRSQNPNSLPWDPSNDIFPRRHELPTSIPHHVGAPKDAAWVWGENDYKGRINLLTAQRVANAAKSEIRTGQTVRLDLPLQIPSSPAFGRKSATHRVVDLGGIAYDDIIDNMNPQSGSQWDGFRHTKTSDIVAPDAPDSKCSIHHWSSSSSTVSHDHTTTTTGGISGRAILLDYWSYAESTPGKLYDPYTGHAIPFSDLQACAAAQGINLLPARDGGDVQVGDILLIRSGWVSRYHSLTDEQRHKAASRHVHVFASQVTGKEEVQEWAGIKQEQATLDWLHDCYFSAVAGDAPSFERWPSQVDWLFHEYVLALWGMPLGEMWDLEELAALCRREKRWTFFLSSAPDVVYGGVGSHPNATAIF